MEQRAASHWFQYFPGNYVWSQQMMSMIDMTAWGAGSGEVHQVGQRLMGRQGDNDAWYDEWTAQAKIMEGRAVAAEEKNRLLTAGTWYLHAMVYYLYGERFMHPGEKKIANYRACMRCFEKGVRYRFPYISRGEVKYLDTTLPAYFLKSPHAAGRAPAMVCFDGLDLCKEMSALFAGVELANRGTTCWPSMARAKGSAAPGGIPSRYDYEVPGSAAYEYMAGHPDVDPQRVGVWASAWEGITARASRPSRSATRPASPGRPLRLSPTWVTRRREMEAGGPRYLGKVPSALGAGRARHGCRDEETGGLSPRRSSAEDRLPHPHHPRRMRYHRARGNGPQALRNGWFKKQNPQDLHRRGGGAEHMQGDNRPMGANYVADWVMENL